MRTDSSSERMLIIEDDPTTGLLLEDLFELSGYEVDWALDGPQALQLMTRLPAYDIVLLDVMLPQKSGFDVLREARRAGVDSPVIVCLGVKVFGCLGFLNTPVRCVRMAG